MKTRDSEFNSLSKQYAQLTKVLKQTQERVSDLQVLLDEKNADISALKCTLASIDSLNNESMNECVKKYDTEISKLKSQLSFQDQDHLTAISKLNHLNSLKDLEKNHLIDQFNQEIQSVENKHALEIQSLISKHDLVLKELELTRKSDLHEYECLFHQKDALERELKNQQEYISHREQEFKMLEFNYQDLQKMYQSETIKFETELSKFQAHERKLLSQFKEQELKHQQELLTAEQVNFLII